MAGALREFVLGGGNVCDAGAGASSSTGRFASQFLAGKGYESAAQGQQQGGVGSAPLPFAMGHQPFNPMNEAERIGNAPSMAPGGMQLQARRTMEEAWGGAAMVGRGPGASWHEEFSMHGGPAAVGAKPVQPKSADAAPMPIHAEPFRCLNGPLRGFFRGEFADAFTAANDSHIAMAVQGVAQLVGAQGLGKLRRRADILGRQVFAERESVEPSHRMFLDERSFVDRQVNELMSSLRMKDAVLGQAPAHHAVHYSQISQDFGRRAQEMHMRMAGSMGGPPMAGQYSNQQQHPCQTPPVEDLAKEFSEKQKIVEEQNAAQAQPSTTSDAEQDLLDHTRALEETMVSSSEPKFRESKFLNFVSKMNTGELKIVDEHLVEGQKERLSQSERMGPVGVDNTRILEEEMKARLDGESVGGAWASAFENFNRPDVSWAEDFAREGPSTIPDEWANEFSNHYATTVPDASMSEQRNYEVSNTNPFESTDNPFELGQELYKNGLLSEAALAFEAAIGKEMHVAESWRMLGMVHAENDDDKQAIAAMVNAHNADPTNLDVLLDLGVSHTNELEAHEAINYLRQWVSQHPEYKNAVALNSFEVNVDETIKLFDSIGHSNPGDVNIFTALGVLYNLSKDYGKAEEAFKHALSLQKDNHSLWNKLGATQANSSNSKEAVKAYREAIGLKSNYTRCWSNMGIGYSNQGLYEESIPYYIRALTMNPDAEPLWGYLKIAMACTGALESLHLVNERNIGALSNLFPI
ncbi:peroxisomal targeting signal 1 receptor [Chloropicon primus]|nr:peroxisomal targeting signal 1 receptor [Chloropicon primus]